MTFKVGIVGYGVVGKRRHNALKNIVDFKVTALSDINFNTGNELQSETEADDENQNLNE